MPAIRDYASNATTVATGTTLVIPVPTVEENDLLVASIVADTANGTWSSSGWKMLYFQVNTAQLALLYRIATASEPADYTFTRSASESFNGRMISIRDVNTTAPFGETDANTGLITMAVNATNGTFTRSAGSFLTDGFANGQNIITSGFAAAGNNTSKVINTVTATVITVTDITGLVTVADTASTQVASGVAVIATQAAAAKYTLPQVTTTKTNSLVLYAAANSGVGVPSIIEGPVSLISGEDGLAESGGDAWTFMPSTGASPSNVTCSNIATGAGIKAAVQIAPPAAGATVIPTYCAADNSVYVNPIHGVTAYDGNVALAATFDTLIGTSINGVTLADATIAAIADVGINSYHSAGRLTSISGSKNWAGATIDLAAANLLTTAAGKNILVHTGPSTPGQIQRFAPAATRKGTAIALLSTTGNWKAWHVHGRGTPFGYQRDVPLIVNTSNTTGLLQTTGTLNANSIDVIGFATSGSGVTTTIWDFYSLWVLDTTTVCGGIAAEPMDIPGIVLAASDGHERKSIVQQGAAQAIIFQPIQIGNGGTNPVFVDLNATAIEFPRQYSLANKQVNYCSVDNVAGITYYAGASDTIKHRNAIISSPSRYHWNLHASTSTSATYDFSGLQVIGAGTITLNKAITITNLTINDYSTLDVSGLNFNGGSILGMPATNDSITISGTTVIQNSAINTTTVTAGNRWASVALADLDVFSGCAFTGSATSGHAIRLTTTGTATFSGNTFTGYGADGTTSAAIFNDSGGAVTITITGGGAPQPLETARGHQL